VQLQRDTLIGRHARSFAYLCSALLVWSCSKTDAPQTLVCDDGSFCQDTDCDTICDLDEGDESVDTDKDGTPDFRDTDSDNDGLPDREEAGDEERGTLPFDRNLNGILDYVETNYPLHPGRGQTAGVGGPTLPDPPAPVMDAGPIEDAALRPEPDAGTIRLDVCPAAALVSTACLAAEVGDAACDGLDNDCDGRVDNDNLCACARGAVRNCFAGPPGRRRVGACQDGTQTCIGDEFSHWGACQRSVGLHSEQCDGLDNDCNGCSDEIPGCASKLSCPAPGDLRIPDTKPFLPYELDATRFYVDNDISSVRWSVRGSACDRLFEALDTEASAQSGKLSFTLENPAAAKTQVVFALSGAYEITLVITTPAGELRCQWVVHVRAPGLRVELCWDKTGPKAQSSAVDLDLHFGKLGSTASWQAPNDCYWGTCRGNTTPWNYANTTPLTQCSGPQAQNYPAYSALGFCPNPRLDADNRLDAHSRAAYVTENVSLDNPRIGDQFRIMVQYNSNVLADAQDADSGPPTSIETHPIVNVYCGGELRGSFGGDPDQSGDAEELGMSQPGEMWRVADIAVLSNGCAVGALKDPAQGSGYWVTQFDSSYGTQ
jgi:hypothetical protein